jgi:branched-chain amino acid transport system ATP-binding protein
MLRLQDVHVHIGKLHILQGVNLSVDAGECAALLGRNGVGKTTTLRAIMGLARKTRGTVEFEGIDLARCQPHEVPRKGIGYVPQGRGIFPNLTVMENLNIGLPGKRDPEREEYVFGCFPRLRERLKQSGSTLSGGEQQMLAIARALVGNPSVLLMDEPFEGLAPIVVEELAAVIARLRAADAMTMVLVEQRTDVALDLAERAVVMERGRVVFDDASVRLRADPDLLHALVGLG